jgi:hypothetical protein
MPMTTMMTVVVVVIDVSLTIENKMKSAEGYKNTNSISVQLGLK